jgi:uncharacterized protein (TIGR00251 family)
MPHDSFIEVRVKPNSPASELRQEADGRWFATLKSPPVDGKANDELIRLVARYFRCSRSAVSIRSGAARRLKLVKIGST